MQNIYDKLSKDIKSLRQQAGLSQAELAKLASIGKTVVFDIEHGKKTIQIDTLLKVLNVLNIQLTWSSPLLKDKE